MLIFVPDVTDNQICRFLKLIDTLSISITAMEQNTVGIVF